MLDRDEFERWMRQAEHTLGSAERDAREGDFAWACFKAEQAAQFALKGLLAAWGVPAFGHSLTRLARRLEEAAKVAIPPEVGEALRELERHYIPSRYPNAFPSGSPFEFYTEEDARRVLEFGRKVLNFVKGVVEGEGGHQAEEGGEGETG